MLIIRVVTPGEHVVHLGLPTPGVTDDDKSFNATVQCEQEDSKLWIEFLKRLELFTLLSAVGQNSSVGVAGEDFWNILPACGYSTSTETVVESERRESNAQ